VTSSASAFTRSVQVFIDSSLQSARLATVARKGLADLIASERLAIAQKLREGNWTSDDGDTVAQLIARREELAAFHDACLRQRAFEHKHND
jgi:hypothetical protein